MPKFESGQIVHHKQFGYRGVVVSVAESIAGSGDHTRPQSANQAPQSANQAPQAHQQHQAAPVDLPRHRPWYHVLVHESATEAVVAEGHLEPDDSVAPVHNPLVHLLFDELRKGRYVRNRMMN